MTSVPRPPLPPSSLSPSRASDFMQCPLLYRFRVIDKLPEKPSEAATRGTLVLRGLGIPTPPVLW
ncbi:PD-(D/E)XK nuclease family protein, partial [Streptomyces griseus]|uniref:PD-(D/E)XK nuclease family protein n=1 Tax=Streptomyces griseus TaxID=1911 RepID=UPI0036A53F12